MYKIVSFSCVPLFKGVELAQLFNAVFIAYYYNVIIALCLLLFLLSTTLHWTGCDINDAERFVKSS